MGTITMLSTEDVWDASACTVRFENGALLARLITCQQMHSRLYQRSYYRPSLSRRSGPAAVKPTSERTIVITSKDFMVP